MFQHSGGATGVEVGTSIPEEFDLSLNLPNPFNPATEVRYQIPEVSNIRLSICDALVREVAVLVDEMKTAGAYKAT